MTLDQVCKELEKVIPPFTDPASSKELGLTPYYFVVDGIHESGDTERELLVKTFRKHQKIPSSYLCLGPE
jgi:hypothetical protein